jgi:type II secretory pathway component PulC
MTIRWPRVPAPLVPSAGRLVAHLPTLAALAVLASVLALHLMPRHDAGQTAAPLTTPPAMLAPPAQTTAAADMNLFGVAAPANNAQQPRPSRLRLELRGTLMPADGSGGRAIVADAAGKEQVYAIGETLPGGPRLESIGRDRVTLRHGANIESLVLPRLSRSGAGVAATTIATPPVEAVTDAAAEPAPETDNVTPSEAPQPAEAAAPGDAPPPEAPAAGSQAAGDASQSSAGTPGDGRPADPV